MVSTPAAAASSQRVVLPVIPELTNPNFLDILVPAPKAGPATEDAMIEEPVPANPLMTALKDVSNRTLTTNGANAYSSSGDSVLDAFYMMRPKANQEEVVRQLAKAWNEDPQATLKVIWNARSIHDGKGEKELFYW